MRLFSLLVLTVWVATGVLAADRLKLEYYYDKDNSSLSLRDFGFADEQRGMAVGTILEGKRARPAGLVTNDGGRTWTELRLPGHGEWLAFSPGAVWLGDMRTTWKSADFGKTWKRVHDLDRILRVLFLDEARGWALGPNKTILVTADGGGHWTGLPDGQLPKTTREFTTFTCGAFADATHGVIAGESRRPRAEGQQVPDWMDPENLRREWPSVGVVLETRDAGKTWSPSETSMFGRLTRVRLAPGGRGLFLVEFRLDFPFPAEVYSLNWTTGKSNRVFRQRDRVVTDVTFHNSAAYMVAAEAPGRLTRSPVPGKLHLLTSVTLNDWSEIPVDYRAVASRAVLASAGGRLWVATDTGMLLATEGGSR